MAFWGDEFIFDDIPCSEYGLMVYHFGSVGQDDVAFQNGEIIEDKIPGRYDTLMYGVVQNQSLEYTLVFGANVLKLLLLSFLLSIVIYWIVCLVNWDGSGCDENSADCDTCPFPCDKHKN